MRILAKIFHGTPPELQGEERLVARPTESPLLAAKYWWWVRLWVREMGAFGFAFSPNSLCQSEGEGFCFVMSLKSQRRRSASADETWADWDYEARWDWL